MIILTIIAIFVLAPVVGAFFTGLITLIALPFGGLASKRIKKVQKEQQKECFRQAKEKTRHVGAPQINYVIVYLTRTGKEKQLYITGYDIEDVIAHAKENVLKHHHILAVWEEKAGE